MSVEPVRDDGWSVRWSIAIIIFVWVSLLVGMVISTRRDAQCKWPDAVVKAKLIEAADGWQDALGIASRCVEQLDLCRNVCR